MRRIADPTVYEFMKPQQDWNVFITIAAFVLGLAQLVFLVNLLKSMFKGKKAEANPWKAATLEWSIPSPAPEHNFHEIPNVYRWPYEYSNGKSERDWVEQSEVVDSTAGGGKP